MKDRVLGEYSYAAQRFSDAVDALAAGTGSIQERVGHAAHYIACAALQETQLPPSFRPRFRALVTAMTCAPDPLGMGTIDATARAMSDQEAVRIAREVLHIYLYVAGDFFGPSGAPLD